MPHNINYKSDFDFILNIATCIKREDGTCEKTPLGWPDFDWVATFWASNKANSYVASRRGDELVNCFDDNGQIHIVVDNHHLGKGPLKVEFHALLPDGIYPDSIRDTYDPQPLDIELVSGSGDCATAVEAELLLPMLKGEPFTYEDFTPAQIAELQKPALDKVKEVDDALKKVEDKEAIITEAENKRETEEKKRIAAEKIRQENEKKRIADTQTWKNELSELKTEVNTSVANAQTATSEATTAATNANQAADDANTAADNLSQIIAAKQDKLTTSDDLNISPENLLSLTDMAKKRLFIDLWNAACDKWGTYNTETGYFELNGFTDITYEEAIEIYSLWSNTTYLRAAYWVAKIRTNLPPGALRDVENLVNAFYSSTIEVINLRDRWIRGQFEATFRYCENLRKILYSNDANFIDFPTDNLTFENCRNLESVNMRFTGTSLDLHWSSKLNFDSVNLLIKHRTGYTSKTLTVKVHKDVYAKLTGDTTNAAAAALSEEELADWQQLLVDAAEQNIQFATV